MASAKAWYWLGLGVLALSLASSGSGQKLMNHASAYVSCARSRALPYLGAVELALGRTQAGVGHLQAVAEQNRARLEAERAQIEAAQAMLQEQRVQEQLRHAQQLLANRALMQRTAFADQFVVAPVVPSVDMPEMPTIEIRNGGRHVIVCPHTGVRVATPAVNVSVAPQNPI